MRETKFIDQNKEKWRDFEHHLDGQYQDAEKLNNLFIQVTDDLSYSRTFYSNRSVRVYLNSVAQRVFFTVYKTKKAPLSKMLNFWSAELPALIYESRKEFRLSFFIFLFAISIGVLSSVMDPEFLRIILGDSYVNMTLENIESGDPMRVYKQKGALGMSFGITLNNLYVAFQTFLFGALFGIGTVIILLTNGIMLGSFQYFFIERDLFLESFLTIWTHGTLEISAIIIAGAAGLTMGKGLLFPGTLTRLQAFQRSARRGLMIMLSITPIIILAGFIEGYLTRYTETSDLIRALFILACLTFVLWYFVWYPYYKVRTGVQSKYKDETLPPSTKEEIKLDKVKSSGEIFTDIFIVFRKQGKALLTISAIGALSYCLLVFTLSGMAATDIFYFPNYIFGTIGVIERFLINKPFPGLFIISTLLFTGITIAIQYYVLKAVDMHKHLSMARSIVLGFKILTGITLMHLIIFTSDWYTIFLFVFLFPLPLLLNFICQKEDKNLLLSSGRTFFLLSKNYGRVLGLFLILLIVSLFFFLIVDTGLIQFFFNYISWIVYFEQGIMDEISIILFTFICMFTIYTLYALVIAGVSIQYFTLCEIKEANFLRERIQHIGEHKTIQGLDKE